MVRSPRELQQALTVCRSEAQAAFGDDSLYLEKWLEENRHVEVQVIVDRYGNGVHVGERDCSVQRRHQKIVEEAPIAGARRRRAARRWPRTRRAAVVAAGYENIGTLEFLRRPATGNYYFIEINCRIQVEHPVTEMLSGIDLVAEQIRIAAGEPLGYSQADVQLRGHAIEFRINAEDVDARLPAAGRPDRDVPAAGRPGRAHGHRTCTAATRCRRTTTRCWASSSSGARTGQRPSRGPGSALDELVVDGVVTNVALPPGAARPPDLPRRRVHDQPARPRRQRRLPGRSRRPERRLTGRRADDRRRRRRAADALPRRASSSPRARSRRSSRIAGRSCWSTASSSTTRRAATSGARRR